jgi:hypothetical protein
MKILRLFGITDKFDCVAARRQQEKCHTADRMKDRDVGIYHKNRVLMRRNERNNFLSAKNSVDGELGGGNENPAIAAANYGDQCWRSGCAVWHQGL